MVLLTHHCRLIAADGDADTLAMSHSSSNFDGNGLAEDINLVFAINRFKELVSQGVTESLAEEIRQ